MITVLLSPVLNWVEKIRIFSTIPDTPDTSIKSPDLNGLNTINNTPEAKFDKEPCNAKPIAKPAAPTIATSDVVLKPKCDIAATITIKNNIP